MAAASYGSKRTGERLGQISPRRKPEIVSPTAVGDDRRRPPPGAEAINRAAHPASCPSGAWRFVTPTVFDFTHRQRRAAAASLPPSLPSFLEVGSFDRDRSPEHGLVRGSLFFAGMFFCGSVTALVRRSARQVAPPYRRSSDHCECRAGSVSFGTRHALGSRRRWAGQRPPCINQARHRRVQLRHRLLPTRRQECAGRPWTDFGSAR